MIRLEHFVVFCGNIDIHCSTLLLFFRHAGHSWGCANERTRFVSANYEKCSLPMLFPLGKVRSHAALLHDISMEILMTADTISVQVMRVLMVA